MYKEKQNPHGTGGELSSRCSESENLGPETCKTNGTSEAKDSLLSETSSSISTVMESQRNNSLWIKDPSTFLFGKGNGSGKESTTPCTGLFATSAVFAPSGAYTDSEPGELSTDAGSTDTEQRERSREFSPANSTPQLPDDDPVNSSPYRERLNINPTTNTVKRKGKMDEWERLRLERFIEEVKSGVLSLSKGNLARTLLEYINPERDITFYEKLVSRRRLNSELAPFMGPRLAKTRNPKQESVPYEPFSPEENDAARALAMLDAPVQFRSVGTVSSCKKQRTAMHRTDRAYRATGNSCSARMCETYPPSGDAPCPKWKFGLFYFE
eukprot:gb/GECG01005168.1/.p1 GENE.gb/GECG01005168.1/~~gb/GECG01005168.1/.p1  ORF type:complete len:326 (+),score=39.02 gb/GECG01005168.1/:1-978(+)